MAAVDNLVVTDAFEFGLLVSLLMTPSLLKLWS